MKRAHTHTHTGYYKQAVGPLPRLPIPAPAPRTRHPPTSARHTLAVTTKLTPPLSPYPPTPTHPHRHTPPPPPTQTTSMRRVAMGAMALASLSAYTSAASVEECLTPATFDATKDYFPAAAGAIVEEARKFTIEYTKGYKVVTNLTGKRQYVLYPCGADEPDVTDLALPAGFQRRTLSVPAQKVVTAETVSYDFLNLLENDQTEMGVTDRVISLSPYAVDACAQKALKCTSNVMAPGLGAAVPGWGAKVEEYDALMTQAGVYFDFSESYKGTAAKDKSVIFSATSETSLLGRGEWIKFAGAFFNLDGVAEQKFDKIKETYYELSDAAKENDARPKVSFIDVDTFSDKVVDYFVISLAGYKRSAVLDAGGWIANVEDFAGVPGVIFPPTRMSRAGWAVPKAAGDERNAAIKAFTAQLADTDIVIDERYSAKVLTKEEALAAYGLTGDDVAFPFIKNGKVFRQDKTGSASGSAWFETGVSRPDIVLMDFVKVIQPETSLVATHDTVFLRDLFAGETKQVLTAAECTRAFPVCGLALTDRAAAICPSDFKECADGSKVFLTASSGCTKHAACPTKDLIEEEEEFKVESVTKQPEAEQEVSAATTTTADKPAVEAPADDKAADATAVEKVEEVPVKAADPVAAELPTKEAQKEAEKPTTEAQKETEVTSPAGMRSASGPVLLLGMIAALSVVALFA